MMCIELAISVTAILNTAYNNYMHSINTCAMRRYEMLISCPPPLIACTRPILCVRYNKCVIMVLVRYRPATTKIDRLPAAAGGSSVVLWYFYQLFLTVTQFLNIKTVNRLRLMVPSIINTKKVIIRSSNVTLFVTINTSLNSRTAENNSLQLFLTISIKIS